MAVSGSRTATDLAITDKVRALTNQKVGFLVQSSRHIPTRKFSRARIAPVGFRLDEVCDEAELLGQNIQNRTRLDITVRVAKDGETRGFLLERQLTFRR